MGVGRSGLVIGRNSLRTSLEYLRSVLFCNAKGPLLSCVFICGRNVLRPPFSVVLTPSGLLGVRDSDAIAAPAVFCDVTEEDVEVEVEGDEEEAVLLEAFDCAETESGVIELDV